MKKKYFSDKIYWGYCIEFVKDDETDDDDYSPVMYDKTDFLGGISESKKEAIEDAYERFPGETFLVSRVRMGVGRHSFDMDDIIEAITNRMADENSVKGVSMTYEYPDEYIKEGAIESLKKILLPVLRAWADENVATENWLPFGELECFQYE